jgi:DNA-binding transcriptional LysR family regulator
MNLRDLSYFEVIADTLHLGRAAEQIGRSQPALSKCISRLEADLGADLFVKDGRGLKLTPVGHVLRDRARRMREVVNIYAQEVTDFAKGAAGKVRVGTGATTAEYLLPAICTAMMEAAPEIRIEVVVGLNDVLRSMLRNGQLDVAIGPLVSNDTPEFSVYELGRDQVVVAARQGHPLVKAGTRLEDLLDYKWILPAGTVALRQWIDKAFDTAGLMRPDVQIETNVISILFRLISQTDFLVFASRHNLRAQRGYSNLCEIEVSETVMDRRLGLIFDAQSYTAPATSRFIEVAKRTASGILKLDDEDDDCALP